LLAHERIADAVAALREAASECPTDPAVHAFLAAALFAAGLPDQAQDAIDQALGLDPGGFWPNLKAGELRLRLGDPNEAERLFLVALRRVDPGTREAGAAADALVRARRAKAQSIAHRALLPSRLHDLLRRRTSPSFPATLESTGERLP
jgi:Flp pilus assembly protein TadD